VTNSSLPSHTSWPLGVVPRLDVPVPEMMRALTIHRDQYGPPATSIRTEIVAAPRLRAHDARRVLVAVLASGPNFNTNFAALGLPVPVFGNGDPAAVHIPGSDALGIVIDAGSAVTRVKVGQAVILDSWTGRAIRGYETHDGFNSQLALVDDERAIPVTGVLRQHAPEQLAAMLLTYGTAFRAVVERLRVRPGESVLIMGGGKGTSFAATQIVKALGARAILVGSNRPLVDSLIARGLADAFVDRRSLAPDVFGVLAADQSHGHWVQKTEPFRDAVRAANGGRLVDKIFEHTGGENFPLLISALEPGGALAFFGATGRGVKGEYKETFFHDGRRFVIDARWVWMRQKQILFRPFEPTAVLDEIGLLPARKVLVWGADRSAQAWVAASLQRSALVAVVASRSREQQGIAALERMGIASDWILDRDQFVLPEDMPDPLTSDGVPNPGYGTDYMRHAQALGKALWRVFGSRQSPDLVVDRADQNTLHFSSFVARDFEESDLQPCGTVVVSGASNLSIRGSHMYCAAQAAEVVRLLSTGTLVLEQDDLAITDLPGLPAVQQQMLDGTMKKPKGVALVQADRPGRPIADYEAAFLGEAMLVADPADDKLIDVRLVGTVACVTLTRPDTLNALSEALVSQLSALVDEVALSRTMCGRAVTALVITGAGRSFVAGADVNAFRGSAEAIGAFAWRNISIFSKLEQLPVPVVALINGFALGGGNELAMSTHYRIVTEAAQLGQPEVKLGIIPGYGGLQRLPRLVGPATAAELCINGEAVDAHRAVEIGLADEFAPSASALPRAVAVARQLVDGTRSVRRRDWNAIAASQRDELRALLARQTVQQLLMARTPPAGEAQDLRAARAAAARDILRAIQFGYEHGFDQGLRNDAKLFGAIAASPAGQEWINRFLAKDRRQSSFKTLLPAEGFRPFRRPLAAV
jgi:enoyl-CoA hydratase